MKITVKLTADELLDTLEAIEGKILHAAIKTIDEDDVTIARYVNDNWNEVCKIQFSAFNSALDMMGIDIEEIVESEPETEADDENEEEGKTLAHIYIKHGKRCISAEDAKGLVAYITEKVLADDRIAEEDKYTFIMNTFVSLGEQFNIDFVDCEEEGQ